MEKKMEHDEMGKEISKRVSKTAEETAAEKIGLDILLSIKDKPKRKQEYWRKKLLKEYAREKRRRLKSGVFTERKGIWLDLNTKNTSDEQ